MVFLDLSKAFDTLENTTLLNKLYTMGLPDSAATLLTFMTNRPQCVYVSGVASLTLSSSSFVSHKARNWAHYLS